MKSKDKTAEPRKNKFCREKFINFIVAKEIVKIGNFTLKSGLKSNIFFNFGVVDNGADMAILGEFYADYIFENYNDCDILYGPAYKGISLAVSASITLYYKYGKSTKVVYNRKEEKLHGEGGKLVGNCKQGRVVILDDVATDCATKYETLSLLRQQSGLDIIGILVGVDREEFDSKSGLSCTHNFSDSSGITILSLCKKSDVLV